jgi:hypothetical protein
LCAKHLDIKVLKLSTRAAMNDLVSKDAERLAALAEQASALFLESQRAPHGEARIDAMRRALTAARAAWAIDPREAPGDAVRAASLAVNACYQLGLAASDERKRAAWMRLAAAWSARALRPDLASHHAFAAFYGRLFAVQALVAWGDHARDRRDAIGARVMTLMDGAPEGARQYAHFALLRAEGARALAWRLEKKEGDASAELDVMIDLLSAPVAAELIESYPEVAAEVLLRAALALLRRAERASARADYVAAQAKADACLAIARGPRTTFAANAAAAHAALSLGEARRATLYVDAASALDPGEGVEAAAFDLAEVSASITVDAATRGDVEIATGRFVQALAFARAAGREAEMLTRLEDSISTRIAEKVEASPRGGLSAAARLVNAREPRLVDAVRRGVERASLKGAADEAVRARVLEAARRLR